MDSRILHYPEVFSLFQSFFQCLAVLVFQLMSCECTFLSCIYKSKNWYQPFALKSNFNCETPNIIYVIICSGFNKKYIGQFRGQPKVRLDFYRQHIQQHEYEKLEIERHLRTRVKGILKFFSFFKMKEKNKILRECYEDHFIKKFKPELN